MIAAGEEQFVAAGNAAQEIPRPLKTQVRLLVQQQVGFIGAAQPVPEFDIRSRPAGVYVIVLIDPHQETRAK